MDKGGNNVRHKLAYSGLIDLVGLLTQRGADEEEAYLDFNTRSFLCKFSSTKREIRRLHRSMIMSVLRERKASTFRQ